MAPRMFRFAPAADNPISQMLSSSKNILPLALVLVLVVLVLFLKRREPLPLPEKPPIVPPPTLSILGEMPDWQRLEIYQETIRREDFERLLSDIFTTGSAWQAYIRIGENEAVVHTGLPEPDDFFTLRFAKPGKQAPVPRRWKRGAELPPAPEGRPLDGLHIAIDPGHIGGEWAKIEARWLLVGDGPPVKEGEMTLLVARLLQPRLEALGARVSLVRKTNEPVTPLRPDSLMELAADSADDQATEATLRKLSERLFYRTAEIRARAEVVNREIQPDLVLCLHFNADAWGDPANPQLVPESHFHILVNGGYTEEEVMLADQRFAMLEKLLGRSHDEEAAVGETVADVFMERTSLPPYSYPPDSANVRQVNGHPCLWARNLLANRLYDCPVLFMEPYVMNSKPDLPRMQAGDYEGLREINGRMQPSIFREYSDALADGLAEHYARARPAAP